jgi:hypothetical protein
MLMLTTIWYLQILEGVEVFTFLHRPEQETERADARSLFVPWLLDVTEKERASDWRDSTSARGKRRARRV